MVQLAAPREAAAARLAFEQQAKFFRGLGDPTRLQILALLLEEERSVGEIVEALGALQGRVSSHLACLRQCGYVTNARDGQRVIYRINDPRVRTIVEWGRQMVADNAEAIAACTRV